MLIPTAKNIAILLFSVLILPAFATADDYPIELEIVSPVAPKLKSKKADPVSHIIQYRSGWPLTFKLSTNDKHLLGTFVPGTGNGPTNPYPEAGTPAWLIFDDADDCLYLEGLAENGVTAPCNDQTGAGEVFLNFTPDIDFPYLADLDPGGALRSHGRPDLRAELAKRYPDNGPEWGGPALSVPTGGAALQGTLDGVGYGPNDDLPGLVVISNTGVGIVYDELVFEGDCDPLDGGGQCQICEPVPVGGVGMCFPPPIGILQSWERTVPAARHNLSGLMGMVGYELNDQERQTTITTSLLVPRHLFTHLEARDPCYDSDNQCDGGGLANRIDAGPVNYPGIDISTSIVELRAFVINGTAPPTFEDCNGDDAVTAADAQCQNQGQGYTLISNEVVLEFVQVGGLIYNCNEVKDPWVGDHGILNYGYNVKRVDLDRNLAGYPDEVCPGGGGGTTRPPR
jgi:hypothetical protein